jgi:hypothetical protein
MGRCRSLKVANPRFSPEATQVLVYVLFARSTEVVQRGGEASWISFGPRCADEPSGATAGGGGGVGRIRAARVGRGHRHLRHADSWRRWRSRRRISGRHLTRVGRRGAAAAQQAAAQRGAAGRRVSAAATQRACATQSADERSWQQRHRLTFGKVGDVLFFFERSLGFVWHALAAPQSMCHASGPWL